MVDVVSGIYKNNKILQKIIKVQMRLEKQRFFLLLRD